MKNQYLISLFVIIIITGLFIFSACKQKVPKIARETSEVNHPEWSKNAVIYEVNIRQYSKDGSFKSFAKDLPRLKKLGIDILWIMPVNPIGELNRKGKLGSYYAVKDYKAINPEFGNIDDFKAMVNETHKLGMKIILDWVPNHAAWDNQMLKVHPDYFMKDSTGKFVSPFDWTDVVRFDYKNPEMRKWMVETMKFWLTETNIDGFRCDVAHMIPVEFWDSCRTELDKVKPIFFLAEADQLFLQKKAFDMTYDWKFYHIMNDIAKGKMNAKSVFKHFAWVDSIYPANSYLMEFTSNHDENSWSGTVFERLGKGVQTFAVIAATVPGMPLIYNGQEAALNHRLNFFDRDPIVWGDYSYSEFYAKLIALKHENQALWNGDFGGSFMRLKSNNDSNVVAFIREKENKAVIIICNITSKKINFKIKDESIIGRYKEIFSGMEVVFEKKAKLNLLPWEYLVYEKE